jgi:hypothetical protein
MTKMSAMLDMLRKSSHVGGQSWRIRMLALDRFMGHLKETNIIIVVAGVAGYLDDSGEI